MLAGLLVLILVALLVIGAMYVLGHQQQPWLVMTAEHARTLSWISRSEGSTATMADLLVAFQQEAGVLPQPVP